VGDEGEHIDASLLGAAVEDPDLGVWNTTAESRLNIRLVLLEAAATSRAYNTQNTSTTRIALRKNVAKNACSLSTYVVPFYIL
jgi:hypothetical protein